MQVTKGVVAKSGLVQIVHPQKRRNAKKAMDACIGRILEIKGVSCGHPQFKNLWKPQNCTYNNFVFQHTH